VFKENLCVFFLVLMPQLRRSLTHTQLLSDVACVSTSSKSPFTLTDVPERSKFACDPPLRSAD